ncbi:hypothetical protein Fot_29755 [Forsythia ovata]|uniref:Uncharacterized protein n=1 Tax=Forsythia ovata TaxID=205694 RepID=A0ABD1TSS3_9LAMI
MRSCHSGLGVDSQGLERGHRVEKWTNREGGQTEGEEPQVGESTEKAIKAGIENFQNQFEFTPDYENLQSFFVNYGARQVLSEIKEMYPSLVLSMIDVNYPAPKEVGDETA